MEDYYSELDEQLESVLDGELASQEVGSSIPRDFLRAPSMGPLWALILTVV